MMNHALGVRMHQILSNIGLLATSESGTRYVKSLVASGAVSSGFDRLPPKMECYRGKNPRTMRQCTRIASNVRDYYGPLATDASPSAGTLVCSSRPRVVPVGTGHPGASRRANTGLYPSPPMWRGARG